MANRAKVGAGLITALSHDGRGITHINGKTTFVEGALIGEQVEFEYIKFKSRYDEAKVSRILQGVAGRQTPDCDFFNICGGCSLQHMDSQNQLQHKQAVLLEQLEHIGKVTPLELLPPMESPSIHYRRKARLGVRYVIKKEKLLIGFREKNGRYLADIEACSVLDPSIGQKIPELREFLLSLENFGEIPQLEIAVGDQQTAIIIRHLKPLSPSDLVKLTTFGQKQGYHIYLQPGGPDSVVLHYPADIEPRLSYHLHDHQIEMLFHPTDFTQVNANINNKLVSLAIELMAPTKNEKFLDLFCGIGNFTLPLAKYSQCVVGIEGSEEMVKRGYENAAHNNITNVEFACQNLAEPTYNNKYLDQHFDGILLDPPRTGAFEIVQMLSKFNARRILYISCNPATLARDAGCLVQQGYTLAKVGVLDMFPHTSHVESIGLFVKN